MVSDLIIFRRVESLYYKLYPRLVNFPKSEKHALCQQIKTIIVELMKNISLGNSVKSKRITYLQEADGCLQVLKILLKLSCRQKYISKGYHRDIDIELTEINKMLSAFIKSSKYKKKDQPVCAGE